MFRKRRGWNAAEETLIAVRAYRLRRERWLYPHSQHCRCHNSAEKFLPHHPTRPPPPPPPQSITRHPQSICGGHFALWFCLLLLHQPRKGVGSIVTRETIQSTNTKNVSLSPVHTILPQSLPISNLTPERKRSDQLVSSNNAYKLLRSSQNIQGVGKGDLLTSSFPTSPSSPTSSMASLSKMGALPNKFSGLRSSASPPHSTAVQTTNRQASITRAWGMTAASENATRRMRKVALQQWSPQLSGEVLRSRPNEHIVEAHGVLRLPPPRQVQLFVGYINPFIKQSINPLQIQFIINQWHLFRQILRHNRRRLRLQPSQREVAKQWPKNVRLDRKKVDLFVKVVLRREAEALKKATSFAEFKRILLGANAKSSVPKQISENLVDLPEVSGGVLFRSSITSKAERPLPSSGTNEKRTRGISKRSLDSSEFEKGEEATKFSAPLQNNTSTTASRNTTEEDNVEDETEDHSDEELREAYNSYNDFLGSACTPKNRTLCTKSLFPRHQVDRSTLFLPPGIYVKRCDNPVWSSGYGGGSVVNSYQAMFNQAARMRSRMALKSLCAAADRMKPGSSAASVNELYHFDAGGSCTCLLPEEECLPTEVRLKVASVVVYNTVKGTATTEVIALTEHVSCQCQRRCENRRCVPPLQLSSYTYDDCYCTCPGSDARCEALLDGREKFTDEELPIPLNGSYILPPCYHGLMDEVHLYHKHCPPPDGQLGGFVPT